MSFNSSAILSSLTKYSNELAMDLQHEIVLKGRTTQFISKQANIKYADKINLMNSTLVFQAGGCGQLSATGSVTLSQNPITVSPFKVEEQICMNDLEQYYLGMSMKAGSTYENFGPDQFAKAYLADKSAKIQAYLDETLWCAATSGTYSNAAHCTLANNGLLYQIDSVYNSSVTLVGGGNGGVTYSGAWTVANAISIVDGMVLNLNQEVLDREDLTLFTSYSNFRVYVQALRNANYYHFTALENNDGISYSIMVPGTNVLMVSVRGLNLANVKGRAVLAPAEVLYAGFDTLEDFENFKVWYSQDFNAIFFRAQGKIGTGISYPQYIVSYK